MSNASTIGFGGPHDLGGTVVPNEELRIDQADRSLAYWERSIHALLALLSTKKPCLLTTDELRRATEGLESSVYNEWGYYEKWAVAITKIMLERHVITQDELDFELNGDSFFKVDDSGEVPILFKEGDLVRIRSENTRLTWRKPHLRCPGYIFGLIGKVNKMVGNFEDPYLLAFRGNGPKQPLYSVAFPMASVWNSSNCTLPNGDGHEHESRTDFNTAWNENDDVIEADVYQEWMLPVARETLQQVHFDDVSHDHNHSHSAPTSNEDGDVCCGGHHDHAEPHVSHHSRHNDASHTHEHGHSHGHSHGHEHSPHKVRFDPATPVHTQHTTPRLHGGDHTPVSPIAGDESAVEVEWNNHVDVIRIESVRETDADFHHKPVDSNDVTVEPLSSSHDHSHGHRHDFDATRESSEQITHPEHRHSAEHNASEESSAELSLSQGIRHTQDVNQETYVDRVHFDPSTPVHTQHSTPRHGGEHTPVSGEERAVAVEWNHHVDLIRVESFRETDADFHHKPVDSTVEPLSSSHDHSHSHGHRHDFDATRESTEQITHPEHRHSAEHNASEESCEELNIRHITRHDSNAESDLSSPTFHSEKQHNSDANRESTEERTPSGRKHSDANAESYSEMTHTERVHYSADGQTKHYHDHTDTHPLNESLFPTPPAHCITTPATTGGDAEHDHDHDHGHSHEGRYEVEMTALEREGEDRAGQVVGEALLRVLYKKGVITRDEIRSKIESLDSAGVNMVGADLVVRCWRDPLFQQRLVNDGPTAAREMGIETSNPNAPTVLRVYANTDTMHNVVVCTLCSCYPFRLLGYSPAWYKSRSYRARVVREPRAVLAEFGTILPAISRVRVLDSTADCRYLVIPQLPRYLRDDPSAVSRMTDAELRALVTRDSMIGVKVL